LYRTHPLRWLLLPLAAALRWSGRLVQTSWLDAMCVAGDEFNVLRFRVAVVGGTRYFCLLLAAPARRKRCWGSMASACGGG
jgi:hypothetical protein